MKESYPFLSFSFFGVGLFVRIMIEVVLNFITLSHLYLGQLFQSIIDRKNSELFHLFPLIPSIAIATKENLQSQSRFLNTVTQKVNAIANKFPVINSLVQRINVRKRRDSLVLGGITALCLCLLILYAFH